MSEPIITVTLALDGLGARTRIHEIARRTGRTSKEVLAHLRDLGVELPSAQSSVDADIATRTITAILGPVIEAIEVAEVVAAEVVAAELGAAENPLFLAPEPKKTRTRKPKAETPVDVPMVETASETPTPKVRAPRTRRTAPAEVVEVVEAPVEAAAEVAAPRTRSRSRRPKADQVDAVVDVVVEATVAEESVAEQPAPRTRSGRGRKPAAVVEFTEPVLPLDDVETAETPETDTPDDDTEAAAPTRSRRSRGSRRGRGRAGQTDLDDDSSSDTAPTEGAVEDAAETEPDTADGEADTDETPGDGAARRRRRRGRRGRGRVVGEDGEETDDTDAAESADAPADGEGAETASADDTEAADGESDNETAEEGDRRRRRRRRRRSSGSGTDEATTEDDPDNTVVHVRESRPAADRPVSDEVQGVRGSTRLEAKRQRRRDTRDSRKRPQILSEAEFLARREAVNRVMAVRQRGDLAQVALLEDGVLVEHFVSRAGSESLMGNIYLGRVQNVLPSMEAAFVDIGRGRNAVLYAGEVNWDAAGLAGKARRIETALGSGDPVLVQVSKDPIGHKGARLTTQISLPGRFLVYVPGGGATGISRKLPDTERKRLKAILDRIVPSDAGVIIRTAAEGVPEEDLAADVERLKAAWEDIKQRSEQKQTAPFQLSAEPDTLIKVVRDLFNSDINKLVLDGPDIQDQIADYVTSVAPELSDRVEKFAPTGAGQDVFSRYRIDEQISKALARKVHLPSGGSLVIDRTEAMTVVDVNTGKYTGSGGNLEETVTKNNLEAAEEIVRQLRLRDIGGIIVVDFIDMVLEANRELVLRRLTEALGRDRSRHQVAEVTSLGLVQMTRKRMGTGLVEAFSEPCSHCAGRGLVLHDMPVDHAAEDDSNGAGRNKRRARNDRPQAKPEPLAEAPRVVAAAARKPDPRGPRAPRDQNATELATTVADTDTSPAATEPTPQDNDRAVAEASQAVAVLVATEPVEAAEPAAEIDGVTAVLAALDAATAEPTPRRRGRRAAGRPAGAPTGAAVPAPIVVEAVEAILDGPSEPVVEAATVVPDSVDGDQAGTTGQDTVEPTRPRRRRAARRPAGPAQQ